MSCLFGIPTQKRYSLLVWLHCSGWQRLWVHEGYLVRVRAALVLSDAPAATVVTRSRIVRTGRKCRSPETLTTVGACARLDFRYYEGDRRIHSGRDGRIVHMDEGSNHVCGGWEGNQQKARKQLCSEGWVGRADCQKSAFGKRNFLQVFTSQDSEEAQGRFLSPCVSALFVNARKTDKSTHGAVVYVQGDVLDVHVSQVVWTYMYPESFWV